MTTKDYTYLLNKPHTLNERHTAELERILSEFPYLQSARAVYLKGLYNNDSFRYNNELKKTAAYTTDRTILFEFITSNEFRSVDSALLQERENAVATIEVAAEVETPPTVEAKDTAPQLKAEDTGLSGIEKLERSIKMLIKEPEPANSTPYEIQQAITSESITAPADVETVANTEPENAQQQEAEPPTAVAEPLGSPLKFDQSETHSFAEWLQLSRLKPIERNEPQAVKTPEVNQPSDAEKQDAEQTAANAGLNKKLDIIDRFIETNPKIAPVKTDKSAWENLTRKTTDTPGIMTETLARVYLEQKKYAKAIQAYEILILKYPEKSVFFADRILEIKDLQQNNN